MAALDFSRDYPDVLATSLPPLTLDRQRIVHSAAFRRLQQKTQVFVAPESDHFRTRLTHTLEVAHRARCLADMTGLNGELAEAAALAHDLGHPPFGHAGEQALGECLREHGGFEHNQHTLRIVEVLEHPYPGFRGLNLTRALRACLASHHTRYDKPHTHPLQAERPPPESAVVDLADRLTYALHDLLDGLYAGLLDPADLEGVTLWRMMYDGPPPRASEGWWGHLRTTMDRIQAHVLADAASGVTAQKPDVEVSAEVRAQLDELDGFLLTRLYRHPRLVHADDHAKRIVAAVFDALVDHVEMLPPRFVKRVAEQGKHRVVADYVAGMTDRYCVEQQARIADSRLDF